MKVISSILLSFVALSSLAQAVIYYPKGLTFDLPVVPEECDFAADVANIVDVTYSQFDNMAAIRSDVMAAVNWLQTEYPESRFGLASFTDKPINPLGYNQPSWTDYCLSIKSTFSDTNAYLQTKLNKLRAGGGLDFPEAQLEALMRAIQTPQLGWRNTPTTPSGKNYVKVTVLVTDSIAHQPSDAVNAAIAAGISPLPSTPNPLDVNPSIIASWENKQCAGMEYPSLAQLGDIIRQQKIIPVFLLAPAGYACDAPSGICPYPELEHIAAETGNPDYLDPVKGMQLVYQGYLDEMNVVGIIQHLGNGFEGFYDQFVEALIQVGLFPGACLDTTTTTTTSTTTTTTTSTTTTTTTTITTTSTTTTSTTTTSTTTTSTTTTSTTTTSTSTTSTTTTSTTTTTTSTTTTTTTSTTSTTTTTTTSTTTSTTTTSTTTTSTTTTSTTTTTTTTSSSSTQNPGELTTTLITTTTTPDVTTTTTVCPCEGCCDINVEVNVDVQVSCGNKTVTEHVVHPTQ